MSSKKKVHETRADILDSAWTLIEKEGADVTLAQIAKHAGISRQSVYDHFGSRGGMLIALVRRTDERLSIKDKLFEAFSNEDPQQRLAQTVDIWIDFVQEIYPVATDLIRLRKTDPDANAAWNDRMTELRLWLQLLTKSFADDGALNKSWSEKAAAEYLWASTSVQTWEQLTIDCAWSETEAREHIKDAVGSVILSTHSHIR